MSAIVGSLTALAMVLFIGVGLLAGVAPAVPFWSSGDDGDAAGTGPLEMLSVASAGPDALRLAREVVPDAALNLVLVDTAAGNTMFSFVSSDSSTQVDVFIPQPEAPSDDWKVQQGPPDIEEPMLGKQLDLTMLAVEANSAAGAVVAEFGCNPTSLTLAPLGNQTGERQTWLVDCNFADGRRVLGLVDAQSGELEVPGPPMDPARVRALAGGPEPVNGPAVQPLDAAADWSAAEFVARDGHILTVRLTASGETIDIDLSQIGVFDCRVECYVNIGSRLGGLAAEDEICIGWLAVRDGHQDGMLWVDRYTCEEGGRVFPP